jgi:hypothetical protein
LVTLSTFHKTGLGSLDAQTAAALVEAAADLALIVDGHGVVQEVFAVDDELDAKLGPGRSWVGQNWIELLNQARRHLNHSGSDGAEQPMLYAGVTLGRRRVLLLGRDLRPMSMLQQRLIDAQQSMERDHGRIRNLEQRYRLVLEECGEPMLVVNAATQTITEVNSAAAAVLEAGTLEAAPALLGRLVSDLFEPRDRAQLDAVLATARAGGQMEVRQLRLADAAVEVELSASLFREDHASFMLLRLAPSPGVPEGLTNGQMSGPPSGRAQPVAESAPGPGGGELPRSVDQLTELIGRVPLKDLVREATDMIERLCIEAALEKTNDNRASAAELLGLSRQSLYVKLHRYGLGDLADAPN